MTEDALKVVVFLFGFFSGGLVFRVWPPARARHKKQDRMIAGFGDPKYREARGVHAHATRLWKVHTGGGS